MANKKNKNLGEKALEYVGTLLIDGIGMAGVKAYQDYKEYQEENSWENKMREMLEENFDSENYEEVIAIADEIIEGQDADEDLIRVAKWYKARGLFLYALQMHNEDYSWRDDINEKAMETLSAAYNQFTLYGNEYGWDDDVLYQQMLIDAIREYLFYARNEAIILLGSDNTDYKSMAQRIYDDMTERVLFEFSKYQNRNWYYELDEEMQNDKDWVEFAEQDAEDSKFTNSQSYERRKYIFIGRDRNQIAGTYQLSDKERLVNWIFTLDQLPPDIEFPLGRPQPGLYMAHPVKTEQYFPMKNAEETLFMEKVREFCWLAQCLGAKEVSFHSIKGMSVSEGYGTSMNVEANVGVKGVSVGAGYGNSYRYDESRGNRQQVERVQHFDPKKKAYCPDDLVWLDSDPAWKDLIKQRLNGNMLDYTYKISSSETCQMSSNEKDEVKANFEYMMVKVNGSYNSEKDTTFSSAKETEWSIHVEFAPLDELTEENTNTIKRTNTMETKFNEVPELTEAAISEMTGTQNLTEKERFEFGKRSHDKFSMPIEDAFVLRGKACVSGRVSSGHININKDSKIVIVDDQGNVQSATVESVVMFNKFLFEAEYGDDCILMLDGIHVDDVKMHSTVYLQSQFLPSMQNGTNFSGNEQEYLNEVKETIEDYDEIGPKERKRLEKTRMRLGISESRAAELEASICQPKLTNEEKEYLDEVREVRKDYDGISQRERKYLEKTRIRLGISIERANELERL